LLAGAAEWVLVPILGSVNPLISTAPDCANGLLGIETGMKRALFCLVTFALLPSIGCTPAQRNPDNIRHETAKATTEAAQDAKAVVKGVEDSLKNKDAADNKGAVDINKATPEQLEALPGIGPAQARRIAAGRPYASADELVKRHLVSKAEYDRISGQVQAQ
jgi:hypothetical protein